MATLLFLFPSKLTVDNTATIEDQRQADNDTLNRYRKIMTQPDFTPLVIDRATITEATIDESHSMPSEHSNTTIVSGNTTTINGKVIDISSGNVHYDNGNGFTMTYTSS